MDAIHLKVSIEEGTAQIQLNRPDRRNALSLGLLEELLGAVRELGSMRSVQVVVVSGAGPVFSAGHDLSEMIDREPDFYDRLFRACTDVMTGVQAIPQPVIARVHGMATAAGCQLVAACDLAFATEDCLFATPGVKIGLFCSTPLVPITRAIGRKRALQMLLTGEAIDAATAVDWGLINRSVPAGVLDVAIEEVSAQMKRHSREVIGMGKAAFYRQLSEPDDSAYRLMESVMGSNATHEDAQEGMAAFLQKRNPQWPSQR
ncbi:MAG: enoyl-CoA hydratase [bacterium]|nr:enoyl-CoA hydratase [bacterium]